MQSACRRQTASAGKPCFVRVLSRAKIQADEQVWAKTIRVVSRPQILRNHQWRCRLVNVAGRSLQRPLKAAAIVRSRSKWMCFGRSSSSIKARCLRESCELSWPHSSTCERTKSTSGSGRSSTSSRTLRSHNPSPSACLSWATSRNLRPSSTSHWSSTGIKWHFMALMAQAGSWPKRRWWHRSNCSARVWRKRRIWRYLPNK